MSLIETMLGRAAISGIQYGFKYRKRLTTRIRYSIFQREQTIRVSISSILKIKESNKYLLIRNKLRPQQYGPIGGAIKYQTTAKSFLNEIEFEDDNAIYPENRAKIKRDLRGYIPGKHLFKFIDWLESEKDREQNCLHRELKEELIEIDERSILESLGTPDFSFLYKVIESPKPIVGKNYKQFRIISVYELSSNYLDSTDFYSRLIIQSENNQNLIWATSDEIRQGYTNQNEIIGSHCSYLFGTKKHLSEDRPWTTKK